MFPGVVKSDLYCEGRERMRDRMQCEKAYADVGSDGAVKLDLRLDFLVLVLHEGVVLVTVGVVVREGLERLGLTTLGHEPTRRLGHEPDEEHLQNGRETLEGRRRAP
jgi:hypothetical protein